MIVFCSSPSLQRHLSRCLGRDTISFAGSLRALPESTEDRGRLCLVHLQSSPEPVDEALVQRLKALKLDVAFASDRPDVNEFLRLSEHRWVAYLNSYMAEIHYRQMLQVTAAGQTWTDPDILREALALARIGGSNRNAMSLLDPLTPRERDVALNVAAGMSNQEIAADLGISEATVKVHLGRVFKKLDLRNRYALASKLQHLKKAS